MQRIVNELGYGGQDVESADYASLMKLAFPSPVAH